MDINDFNKWGSLMLVVISVCLIAISGLFFAGVYFLMDTTATAFEGANCTIANNSLVSTCQELWDMALYPFLNLRSVLIWLSFFFIFTLVLGMLLFGYQSGTKPIMMGVLVVAEILITYGSLHIANMYRIIVENDVMRAMLSDFTVYNKVMLNFPWFVFIVSLFSIVLGIVNWQKPSVNSTTDELNY